MTGSMDKVILMCVVLCCATSVFCQTEADANNQSNNSSSDLTEGRTFGHHLFKRLSFAIIPTAFVVGVIITLLAALTVVSIKGLGVGIILLVISLGQILARSFSSAPVPLPQYNAPQVPIVYQRQAESAPIWLEKEW